MSLYFSQTTTPYSRGIIQLIEDEMGFPRGFISADTERMAYWTNLVNLTFSDFWRVAIPASGKWQLDDSNQTDYDIFYTNIVSGQQDYAIDTDQDGNKILDIYKVLVLPSSTATKYVEVCPVDQQSDRNSNLDIEVSTSGTPYVYDKTANAIFLDPTPNYSVSKGIKFYGLRESSYFTVNDTTKQPGVPGILHEYFVIKPCLRHTGRNNISNYNDLLRRVVQFEGDEERGIHGEIAKYYARRSKDERNIITGKKIKYI